MTTRICRFLIATGFGLGGYLQAGLPVQGTQRPVNRVSLGTYLPGVSDGGASARAVRGDVDGDGRADLIWRNASSGMVYLMTVSGTAPKGGSVLHTEPNPDWQIAGQGDLDGDGKVDLVWRNITTGEVYGMLLDGGAIKGGGMIHTEPNTLWRIAAVADLDGDGKADLVWRNAGDGTIYGMLLDGLSIKGGSVIHSEPDTAWELLGSRDLDGDGRADLLWRHRGHGMVYGMYLDGLSVKAGQVLHQESNPDWFITMLADVNDDGMADLIWRNASSGDVYIMPLGVTGAQPGAVVWTEPNPDWQIVATGDMDGDGKEDLVWWNRITGDVYQMRMDGPSVKGSSLLWRESDTSWTIQQRVPRSRIVVTPVYSSVTPVVYSQKLEWSPDGNTIAFNGGGDNGGWDVYTVGAVWDAKPVSVTKWTDQNWAAGGRTPSYLGNGELTYWAGVFDGDSNIWFMRSAYGQVENSPAPSMFKSYTGAQVLSNWSPNQVTFSSDGGKAMVAWDSQANLLEWNSASVTPTSTAFPEASQAVLSREGTHVAYLNKDGMVVVLELATSQTTVVGQGQYPSWAAGGKLGFVGAMSYVVYTVGTGKTESFTIPEDMPMLWLQNAQISWDGTKIAFRTFEEPHPGAPSTLGQGVSIGRLTYR